MSAEPTKLLRASEVAAMLGVSRSTVRTMVHRGLIRAVSIAGSPHFKFRLADVQAAIRDVEPRPPADSELIHVTPRKAA